MTDLSAKAAFGIAGLDNITDGGLARGRLFLLEGSPGTGKTTIATQFLIEGAAAGERGLYITLSETDDEFRAGAASHGWDLSGIEIFELMPPEDRTSNSSRACSTRPISSSARPPSASSRCSSA